MFVWIFSLFLLAHPLNFFSEPQSPEQENVEEEEDEEEDICYIPVLDREDDS